MSENASRTLEQRETFSLISDLKGRSTEDIMHLLLFHCENRACEMEFPVFQEQSNSIVYCPRCKGMVVKKTDSIIRVTRITE